jgi:hypothetical protein
VTPLFWAKSAAVLSVIYGGANAHQFLSCYADVREKSRVFAEMVAEAGGSIARLRVVRTILYLVAPLCYLWALRGAGVPGFFLAATGAKFGVSSLLGIGTEKRILRGAEYRPLDHRLARLDAILNITLAALAVWLILRAWT